VEQAVVCVHDGDDVAEDDGDDDDAG